MSVALHIQIVLCLGLSNVKENVMLAAVMLWVLVGVPDLPRYTEPLECKQALQKSLKKHPNARCVRMKVYHYV